MASWQRFLNVAGPPSAVRPLCCKTACAVGSEIGIEANDATGGSQLRQTDEEHRRIDKHSRQPDFLCGEETGQHEERSNYTNGYAEVSNYRTTNRLFSDDAH